MADFLCFGDWDSTVKTTEDDGFFTLEIDHATGDFKGAHTFSDGTSFSVWGSCQHPNGGGPRHYIDIWEPRQGFAFHYFGEIEFKSSGKHVTKPGAKRRKVAKLKVGEKSLVDDDWVGTHTT